MARNKQTKSERLFEELCDEHNIVYRLPELDDRKQPDYELRIGDRLVVAEVKQIEPNDDDKRFAEALANEGRASLRDNPNMMARRVRNQIKTSSAQIKSYLEDNPGTPAVLS